MKTRFLIGEMAALNHTTVKTLRYYDQIGLFKPATVDHTTGYRYYEAQQFERLNTIQYLKSMGLSLAAIKQHLEQRSLPNFIDLLQDQETQIDQQIAALTATKQRFSQRLRDLAVAQQQPPLGVPRVQSLATRQIIKLDQTIQTNDELEVALRHLENRSGLRGSIFIGGVGLTIAAAQLKRRAFQTYNAIFVMVGDTPVTSSLATVLPAGRYASLYFNGNHTQSSPYYQQLLAFMADHQYQIGGAAVERTIVDQYVSQAPEDYLTEIQIPIAN